MWPHPTIMDVLHTDREREVQASILRKQAYLAAAAASPEIDAPGEGGSSTVISRSKNSPNPLGLKTISRSARSLLAHLAAFAVRSTMAS
jgi:hypothetical protein